MRRTLDARARYGATARPEFYFAGVLFCEANGETERALQMLEDELREIAGRGEFWREATRRLKKCELLREMGLPWEDEAARVREVAAKLKDSTTIEEGLTRL